MGFIMTNQNYKIAVSATTGLEAIVKNEIKRMGYAVTHVVNGLIFLEGDIEVIASLNINLRVADRVYIVANSFVAQSWEALYQGVFQIDWQAYLRMDDAFPVQAKSVKSKLFSLSDIQGISKKAIVNKLAHHYKADWFKETGSKIQVHVNIYEDQVLVLLDTSDVALHKRGYREKANDAPLKETLAAGLVLLSNWRFKGQLIDPFCGSGTLLIEAAMIMRNIAPGLNRSFGFESWKIANPERIKSVRKKAYEAIRHDDKSHLFGSDINAKTIEIAKENAINAGVDDCITFSVSDILKQSGSKFEGVVITNPPYGERLSDKKAVEQLYKALRANLDKDLTTGCFVLTAFEDFETAFGSKADKNRKLYNGNLKCYYYQYLKLD